MKPYLFLLFLLAGVVFSACGPLQAFRPDTAVISTPTQAVGVQPTDTLEPPAYQMPEVDVTEYVVDGAPGEHSNLYTNPEFGLSFQIPEGWYGPDEYISGDTLRVAVGSDVVYRYGTDSTEQVYTQKDGYQVVVQFTRKDQNTFWRDTLQLLDSLAAGESISSGRSMMIKVCDLQIGRFEGMEYIATLSESAQTEPLYARQVILYDADSNLVTMMGNPNNVQLASGGDWRAAYEAVDAKYQAQFEMIVNSLVVD